MRYAVLFLALMLAACSRGSFHMTDISGAMPRLDFHLTRAGDERPVVGGDYRGKVVILYFGYTNCPDICPAALANMAGVLSKVASPNVRLLFVTVDPNRDTLPVLDRYVHAFSPEFDGLRGSDEELADVARRYRVAYSVDPKPPYTVMHSNAVFFFDPTGRIRLVTTDTTDTDAIAEDVTRLLRQQ